ncbi:MAG: response regulator [Pseudomonadota bacterium]
MSEKNTNANQSGHVLIVDDHALVRKMVASSLIREGFNIVAVSSGTEAIETLQQPHTIACVLLDLSMPGMSGEEVIMQLAEQWPTLPIIVYSAHDESTVSHKLDYDSIVGYLQKPFDPQVLKNTLNDAMARRP